MISAPVKTGRAYLMPYSEAAMRRSEKKLIFLLIAGMLLSLCACGSTGKYKVVRTLSKQELYMGFRSGDSVSYYVTGALKVMQADGTVSSLSRKWFGDDRVAFTSDAGALDSAGSIPARKLIVGVDENAFPMSYKGNGQYTGFDVELAGALCQKLGWQAEYISIQSKNAYVELSSGNVDVAWGGLALDSQAKNYAVFGPYMKNSVVIAALSGSSSNIKGKTLGMDVSQSSMDALDANAGVKSKFGKIIRSAGTADDLFASLQDGGCDMVVTNSTAVDYLNRH